MVWDTVRFDSLPPDRMAALEALVGPPDGWTARRDLQLRLLAELGLRSDHSFLDLGCGPLRAGLPLIATLAPGQYTGIDVDADCIAGARALVSEFNLENRTPRIVQSATFGADEIPDEVRFDRIWAFQVFIHLTEPLVKAGFAALGKRLADQGEAWITLRIQDDAPGFEVTGAWRDVYAINHAPLSYFAGLAADNGLSLTRLGRFDGRTKTGWLADDAPQAGPVTQVMVALRRTF
ncbi:SAM-dependent methyltransferase [Tateyamaria sp. 1078]